MLIFTTVTKLKAIIFKNAKYFEEWVPVTTLLERRHGIVHLLFNKKKKKLICISQTEVGVSLIV